jgi:hypothetical protein
MAEQHRPACMAVVQSSVRSDRDQRHEHGRDLVDYAEHRRLDRH